MAKEKEYTKRIKTECLKKNDKILFPMDLYWSVIRSVANLNRNAKVDRLIEKDEVLYSVIKNGVQDGQFMVVRNY